MNPIYELTDHAHSEEELAPWLDACGTGRETIDGLLLTALDCAWGNWKAAAKPLMHPYANPAYLRAAETSPWRWDDCLPAGLFTYGLDTEQWHRIIAAMNDLGRFGLVDTAIVRRDLMDGEESVLAIRDNWEVADFDACEWSDPNAADPYICVVYDLRRLAEDLELPFADTGSTIALTVQQALPEGVEPTDPEPEERPLIQADPALTEALRQGFAWQYPAAELAGVPAKVSVTGIVHKAEQTTLERPGFLAKDGLTAAEMGTALHAFLEHADFAALAAAKQAGTLETAIPAERDRQVEAKLTASEIAEKLDAGRIRRFVESEAFARICAADEVLRELDFITALPAAEVLTAQGTAPADSAAVAQAKVLVQGIADLVLVFPDHLELLDYKTDRRKSEDDFLAAYRAQLDLYALAISKRFAPKPVTYKGIYSLELGKLIEVK